ncbi:hypothetical protein C4K18_4050 [Pseudomonas chlororaphis subsp. aurantiaca]|nr:hypothetical protein C4K18_4050 [Pseudomonas chlororaphis subsp. aurantiaca]
MTCLALFFSVTGRALHKLAACHQVLEMVLPQPHSQLPAAVQ